MKLEDLVLQFEIRVWMPSEYCDAVEVAISSLIERERADAVKAALVGVVPRPSEPDLTSSKDQYGAVRCLSCGAPNDSHVEAECPRWAAGRWARDQATARYLEQMEK